MKVKVWTPINDTFINKEPLNQDKIKIIHETKKKEEEKKLEINVNNKIINDSDNQICNWLDNIKNTNLEQKNFNDNENKNKTSSPYKPSFFIRCIGCNQELCRDKFSIEELAKIDTRKRCIECKKIITKKYREKNEESIWESALKMGHIIDGYCPEKFRNSFKAKKIWSEEYMEKCKQLQLSLELSGPIDEHIKENINNKIDDSGIVNDLVLKNNYIYKSVPGKYVIPEEICNKLYNKFGRKLKVKENIYKLFQPNTLGV